MNQIQTSGEARRFNAERLTEIIMKAVGDSEFCKDMVEMSVVAETNKFPMAETCDRYFRDGVASVAASIALFHEWKERRLHALAEIDLMDLAPRGPQA